MRRFPAGVAVLTVDAEGERLGLTVGTTISLSLEPPLVGVSISRQAAMHELLRTAGGFALSLLDGIDWHDGAIAPLLDGALGWIEARLVDEQETGDHTLFVGGVVSVEPGRSGPALVHVGQGYAAV